jgi:hypothetical protein
MHSDMLEGVKTHWNMLKRYNDQVSPGDPLPPDPSPNHLSPTANCRRLGWVRLG